MENFRFHMYTDIVFGRGAEDHAGGKVKEYGGTKVMLIYGGGSIKHSGLYDKVILSLREQGIPFVEWGGVQPNPLLSHVYSGCEKAKAEGVDFLLAVGGGSVIDTAKGIALGLAYAGDLWDIYMGRQAPVAMAPVGAIPTLAAAGSETSRSSVLVNDAQRLKRGILYDVCRPVFALMNPEWTYTMPAWQTAAGAADIFSHAFERYFYPSDTYISDKIAEGVMKTVVKYAPIALADAQNYKARAEIMLAGALAHNDITGLGRKNMVLERSCHGLEVNLSGIFDTTHGAGLSVLMPAWLAYTFRRTDMSRHLQFATEVWDVEPDFSDPEGTVLEGIRRFRAWLKGMGLPLTLTELGLKEENIQDIMQKNAPTGKETLGVLTTMTAQDMENIYRSVL
jgi:alcohol dehydrogenase YqhD (iron-dependent ADH family)